MAVGVFMILFEVGFTALRKVCSFIMRAGRTFDPIANYFDFDFKYNCSTLSRAQGVFRKNFSEEFMEGSFLKQLMLMMAANSSQL